MHAAVVGSLLARVPVRYLLPHITVVDFFFIPSK